MPTFEEIRVALDEEWDEFLVERNSQGKLTVAENWRRSNPGEWQKLSTYRTAGGVRPTLVTSFGKQMVEHLDVWHLVGSIEPPPPPPPPPPGATILPVTFKGMYNAKANEVIRAAGPLSDVSIRVAVAGVVIEYIEFLNATRDRTRPGTIDGSGSTNLIVRHCEIRGDGTQQNQGIYVQGGTGLKVLDCQIFDPGNDRYFDHCLYLNNTKDFLVERLTATALHGACIHAYSGGATGVVRDSELGRAAWNVVSWGSGNNVTVENSRLSNAIKVENGRGYAIEAASSGIVTLKNSVVCGAASAGNVAGKHGVNQNGGTFIDGGGNTFSAACT